MTNTQARTAGKSIREILQHGSGPICAAAGTLLYWARQLKNSDRPQNLDRLQSILLAEVERFEQSLRDQHIRHDHVVAARYQVCAFLDETVAAKPWGAGWPSTSLLVHFHQETWGGEKFFETLERLKENPAENLDLLELSYLCLSYGFQGMYMVKEAGAQHVENIRQRLADLLRQLHTPPSSVLSEQWRSTAPARKRVVPVVPLWLAAVFTLLFFGLAYFYLALRLNQHTDPVLSSIYALRVRVAEPALAQEPRLKTQRFLEQEIKQGLVSVTDYADRSVVTLLADTLFESASADIQPAAQATLDRIGQELAKYNGRILVSGYTDNVPITTLRFQSNWDLSKARAETVRNALLGHVANDRMQIEGRADTNPIAPNNTAAQRAKNRRVEITLFTSR